MMAGNVLTFTTTEHLVLAASGTKRLLMACLLGGLVGLEREWRHKDSGLRTNMLISMGAALFTIMSAVLAGDMTPDKSRVASNIVQGIGFLGAGLILHTRSRVLGLTSAATVFVVAAIGMTCGAGLYLEALLATLILLAALQMVKAVEDKLDRKRYPMLYEVRAEVGEQADAAMAARRMLTAVLKVMDEEGHHLEAGKRDNLAGLERVTFSVMATRKGHARMLRELKASDATDAVASFRDREDE